MSKDRELLQEAWIAHWQSLDPIISRKDAKRTIEQIVNDYAKRRGIDARMSQPQGTVVMESAFRKYSMECAIKGCQRLAAPQGDAEAFTRSLVERGQKRMRQHIASREQGDAGRLADELESFVKNNTDANNHKALFPRRKTYITARLKEDDWTSIIAALRAEGTPAFAVKGPDGKTIIGSISIEREEAISYVCYEKASSRSRERNDYRAYWPSYEAQGYTCVPGVFVEKK